MNLNTKTNIPNTYPLDMCDRIKEARIKKALTQEQLGNKLNVAPQTVAKWETNYQPTTPRLSTMIELCEILEVSRDWIEKGAESRSNTVFDKKLLVECITLAFAQETDIEKSVDLGVHAYQIKNANSTGELIMRLSS